MAVKSFTARWMNALRQPRVALLVHEGRKQLVLYGRLISESDQRSCIAEGVVAEVADRRTLERQSGSAE